MFQPGHGALFHNKENRLFACRTAPAAWLSKVQTELWDAINALLNKNLKNVSVQKKNKNHVHGIHLPCIMGYYQQYQEHLMITAWHSQHVNLVEVFNKTKVIQHINIKLDSSLFWNLCITAWFLVEKLPKQIHCKPHVDWKNIVSVCVLIVYTIPSFNFDHKQPSWIVLWEIGLVIQLPS
ncbi:hypothetical protein M422DRAFT_51751 [Sphaerobolus stellatus SS14]|uniref:Uncharacterized protein n=1 Tax=Sphaerobolus stellatus (strain SS14) TaxID=990650 RepID=A0A0C9VBU6_SPHS4|nr:hypothetical protein M422DRAFT_51751 [Sphaerobolus stellatus SS14]